MLLLVRHAKASRDDPDLDDEARPLNTRGARDAAAMARRLAQRPHRPDVIVTSPALRARRTAEAIGAGIGLEPESLVVDTRIYDASAAELLAVIRALDDRHTRVILVGHHPGMTDTVNALTGAVIEKMPTCAVAEVHLSGRPWTELIEGGATLVALLKPKDLAL
jgi:phosphohistidine phosphatase